MIRNFVTGIVVGGVVAGLGLAVVSQLAPMPPAGAGADSETATVAEVVVVAPTPIAPAVEIEPEASSTPATTPAQPAADPGMEATTDAPSATEPSAPKAPETVATALPEPAAPLPEPVAPLASAGAASDASTAVPTAVVPENAVPKADAKTLAPAASAEAPAGLNTPGATDADAPQVEAGMDTAPRAASPAMLPSAAGTDAVPGQADLPPPAPAETTETLLTPAPTDQPDAPALMELDPQPETEIAVEPMSPEGAIPEQAPLAEATAEPQPLPKVLNSSQPETLAPSAGLTKSVDGVTVGRLPSIAADDAPDAGTDPATAAPVVPTDTTPLAQFAAPFTNDLGKPLFAVLLVDTGASDLDRAKLAALPFAVSFVIDPLDPNAAAAEAIYRAAGKEVVMLASGIPAGATASDLEQTFQANAASLPEAVAVMDIGAAGFQDNRPLATMVVPLVKDQGRGLVTFDAGLNAADQVARREGVPAAVIFRDLDAGGEDSPLIRRYLDRAAFKAAQEGRVAVVGTTRPETIAALMEWSLEGRGASVALAPISAVLAVQ
ncbi:hypothetical protein GCM10010873_29860 [Cypionkella aquatica]|uniref:Divergent polysaccharide deacetylase n=1 Tax=Cypionkella aquatica TaxID=1756042 RepID=A0AA37TUP4_9RHOB|nr:divergent polysaccharide deacetylase family protein [Cypionkella aquatica]GLS88012.1 hypothetical protein GCM10010873_29860 [Cypionkella aquatica]